MRTIRSGRDTFARIITIAFLVAATMTWGGGEGASAAASDWFRPGATFDHQFPDPSVTPVGPFSIAYSTGQGGAHLPAMWTTDYATWTARAEERDTADPCYDQYENDAWENPGVGVAVSSPSIGNGCMSHEVWAPTVAFLKDRWVAFAAIRQQGDRFCIYRAESSTALGPFTTSPRSPFVCSKHDPNGSIDPDLYVDDSGDAYLLWKNEGKPGVRPTTIWTQQLNATGSAWAPGSKSVKLLETTQSWEMSNPATRAGVIENPSMVRHQGTYYLFYSGNEFRTSSYAQGYATCKGPLGPCQKRTLSGPMAGLSGTGRWGAGGGDAFVDDRGRLLLQYHAWDRSGGQSAGGLRKPHTAHLVLNKGALSVKRADDVRGAEQDYIWNYHPGGGFSSSRQSIGGTYTPIAGRFGADAADDVMFVGTADLPDPVWRHRAGGARTNTSVERNGSHVPLVGNFDGDPDDTDDIYWYAPLGDPENAGSTYGDEYWLHDRNGGHRVLDSAAVKQDGFALPLTGDFDGNGIDEIFWYAPGPTPDPIWELSGDTPTVRPFEVNGYYQYPQVGDFDGNGTDDIMWYAPGTRPDYTWFFDHSGGFRSERKTANGVYVPMTGDFDGNGVDDIVWYGPGGSRDYEWNFRRGGSFVSKNRVVNGYYTTTIGDFDGNGHDDILWYG